MNNAKSESQERPRLDADLSGWVESLIGGKIVDQNRQGRWRQQWFLDVDTPNGLRKVLVRMPRVATTRPAREPIERAIKEAAILRVLTDAGIRVPRYYGIDEKTHSILIDQVEGSADFSLIKDEAARDKIKHEFFAELAKVHRLPLEELDLDPAVLPRPATAEDLALGKYRMSLNLYNEWHAKLDPDPLLDFGYRWLHKNYPRHMDRVRLIQADVGPGQFLCTGDRLTAIIDWELGRIGDPMLDFGNMRMRNTLYPIGSLTKYFEYYEERSGIPLDVNALQYYTIASGVLTCTSYVRALQRPTVNEEMMVPLLGWDVTLRRLLCEAVLELHGIEAEPPEDPVPEAVPTGDLHDFLVEALQQIKSTETLEYRDYQLRGAIGVATVLRDSARVGRTIEAAELDDLGTVLGRRPTSVKEAFAEIARRVWDGDAPPVDKMFPAFYRIMSRRDRLLRPAMIAQESDPLERLPEALRRRLKP
jgi:aminoglycoside phosphotransferase (APT) family kinase protein